MLTALQRARFTVVLVGARNPQNIGAAARAMQDFGFSDLRVVNEYAAPFEAAQLEAKSAVGAAGVMRNAQIFTSLGQAVANCTLVIGTTAIGARELQQTVMPIQQVAEQIHTTLHNPTHRVALLFGSEKTGLTNEQLSHCSALATIPLFAPLREDGTPARHLSMNLGQSVAVCLYELTRDGLEGAREMPTQHGMPATQEDRERLTQMLLHAMQHTGYTRRFPANARETVVRRLAQQLGTTHLEATTWMAFLKQIVKEEAEGREDSL
jgi:TrmH family RNA methyltransferase